MTARAASFTAEVVRREQLSPHLVRVVLAGPGLSGFATTGVPDEWVALTVPGQYQTRYYTVRGWTGGELWLDVVIHDDGLVTRWASGDCVGDTVTVSAPSGSFSMPDGAGWLVLVGDLTALPAIARILEAGPRVPVAAWVESADGVVSGYLPDDASVTWVAPPPDGPSATARLVEGLDWPPGAGYFWMAGESAQMRAIRKHLMRDLRWPASAYDVMGYWRAGQPRRLRAVDPAPIWRAGRAVGKTDEQIWADYDDARAAHEADEASGAPEVRGG